MVTNCGSSYGSRLELCHKYIQDVCSLELIKNNYIHEKLFIVLLLQFIDLRSSYM